MNQVAHSITIRRASISDMVSLEEFYNENFPEKPVLSDMKIWEWTFANNPYRFSGTPFFIIDDAGTIKGSIGYLSVRFCIGSQIQHGFHPVNYFVLDDYKGLPALRLFRNVISESEVGYASSFSRDAAKLFKTSRWLDLSDHVNNYYLPLRRGENKIKSWNIFTKELVKRTIQSLVQNTLHTIFKIPTLSNFQILAKDKFDEGLYSHIEINDNKTQGVLRDYSFINWRYVKSPRLNCIYFYVLQNNKCRALAIVHHDKKDNKAIIMDIIAGNILSGNLLFLVVSIIKYCKKQGFSSISTTMLNHKIKNIFRLAGFGVSASSFGLMVFAKNKEFKRLLADPERWDYWIGHSDIY